MLCFAKNVNYLNVIDHNNDIIRELLAENERLKNENSAFIANAAGIEKPELERLEAENLRLMDKLKMADKKIKLEFDNIQKLTEENNALCAGLKTTDHQPILNSGNETDKFPGEIKDILLSTLEQALKAAPTGSRRADVIKDIIDNNDYKGILAERSKKLKVVMTGYKTMTNKISDYLDKIGLKRISENNHYKMYYYDDPRYYTTISKSSSDTQHGDMNEVLEIIRKMM